MQYNFDKIIDRSNTNSMSVEGYKDYLFDGGKGLQIPVEEREIIRMWVADMEFATAPEIIEALKKYLDHGIFGYSKVFDPEYAAAFSNWTQTQYQWTFNKEHLVYSHGIIPALIDLIDYTCKKKEKVLFMTPAYGFFQFAADFQGREVLLSNLVRKGGKYYMDFDDLREKTAREDVKLCIFCSPHNPMGRIWTEEELTTFGEICLDNGVTIIADEVHCDLLRKGKQFIPLAKLFPQSDQIITCMAPSKTFNLAGFMFANLIIPNETLRAQWHDNHLGIQNPLSIVAAQTAYTQGQAWLESLKAYLDRNFEFLQAYLAENLPRALFHIPDATYLAWVDLSAYFPKEENLTLFFANEAGVLLEGGNMFVENADGYIRLNLACPRAKLEEGLDRIKKAIVKIPVIQGH